MNLRPKSRSTSAIFWGGMRMARVETLRPFTQAFWAVCFTALKMHLRTESLGFGLRLARAGLFPLPERG